MALFHLQYHTIALKLKAFGAMRAFTSESPIRFDRCNREEPVTWFE